MSESSGRFAVETLAVLGLRLAFFLLASRYLKHALFADLRQVIHDETSTVAGNGSEFANGATSGVESPDEDDTTSPNGLGNNYSLRDQLYSLRTAGTSSSSILPTTIPPSASTRRPSTGSPRGKPRSAAPSSHRSGSTTIKSTNHGTFSKLSGAVFCLSVSECSTLFALIMFGGALQEQSRLFNWNVSLTSTLAIIVLIAPLGMCLLLTLRRTATSKSVKQTALLTAIPFSIYVVLFYVMGEYIADILGVEHGSFKLGVIGPTLDRVCVPGSALIAALSGGGAVITAWDAFEWRERFKAEVVTEGHINAAARSLAQTRMDLAARQAEIDALQSATNDNTSKGFFAIFSSSPNAARVKALQTELKGLEVMESQLSHDLQLMKKRKKIAELSKTWSGKAWEALGWAFSVYCVYRVAMCVVNLAFGSALSSGSTGSHRSSPSDVTSAVLSYIAKSLGLDFDVHWWTKAIGLILTGSIILVNINAVLGYVSRAFRATSAGVSASFMLLFLSQLMAVYLLTSLISLPHPDLSDAEDSSSAAILLNTLPDFRVFARLFDAVFLAVALACFIVRYLQRKIRVDENLGLQDFV